MAKERGRERERERERKVCVCVLLAHAYSTHVKLASLSTLIHKLIASV